MNSLVKISQIAYFFLLMLLFSFIIVHQLTGTETVSTYIVILFSIILIPIFDRIYNIFQSNSVRKTESYKALEAFWIILWIILAIVLLVMEYVSIGALIVCVWLFAVYLKWDARLFFVTAIIVLCYVALFLFLDQNAQAEILSIYLYYLLIIGVLVQILQTFFFSKS